jgi:hypothetical protein
VSDVRLPTRPHPVGWLAPAALVLLAWAAGLPTAYLLILLHLGVPHVVVPLLLVLLAVASVGLTARVRRASRRAVPSGDAAAEEDGRRARFATLPQRAALLMNAVLLASGLVAGLLVLLGGTGFSIGRGPDSGLVVLVVWGFLLLAAVLPCAVLNGMWTLDPRTAAAEAAVLRGTGSRTRGVLLLARAIASVTWSAYGLLAVLVLVAAVLGAV